MRITGHYLDRYMSSVGNLRRLLMQRVRRAAAHHDEDPEPWAQLVDDELVRLQEMGLLDDAAYARDKARSLIRKGNGTRKVRAKLMEKFVPSALIDAALDAIVEEMDVDPEWAAAVKYARKRRMGPWGPKKDRDGRQKDLRRFGRAGFNFDMALRILDTESIDELQEAEEAGRRL